jgi:hypothetical protein
LALSRRRPLLRKVEVVVLSGVTVGLVVLFGFAIIRAFGADVTKCSTKLSADSTTGLVLGLIALAGFGTGRLVAMARKWIDDSPAVRDSDVVRTGGALQAVLAAFLILAAALLGYETYALANSANAPPITSYVRCAAAYSPSLSAIAGFFVSMLLGNWLWYPTR